VLRNACVHICAKMVELNDSERYLIGERTSDVDG